jgi:hypothetical protein
LVPINAVYRVVSREQNGTGAIFHPREQEHVIGSEVEHPEEKYDKRSTTLFTGILATEAPGDAIENFIASKMNVNARGDLKSFERCKESRASGKRHLTFERQSGDPASYCWCYNCFGAVTSLRANDEKGVSMNAQRQESSCYIKCEVRWAPKACPRCQREATGHGWLFTEQAPSSPVEDKRTPVGQVFVHDAEDCVVLADSERSTAHRQAP